MVKCFTIRTGKVICEKGKNKKGAFAGSKGARKNFDRSKITKGRPSSPEPRAVRARKLRQMKKSGTAPKGVKKVLPKIKPKRKLVNKSKIKPPIIQSKSNEAGEDYIDEELEKIETILANEEYSVRVDLAKQLQANPRLFAKYDKKNFKRDMEKYLQGTIGIDLNIMGSTSGTMIRNQIYGKLGGSYSGMGISDKKLTKRKIDKVINEVIKNAGRSGMSYGFDLPFKQTKTLLINKKVSSFKYLQKIKIPATYKRKPGKGRKSMFNNTKNGSWGWFEENGLNVRKNIIS